MDMFYSPDTSKTYPGFSNLRCSKSQRLVRDGRPRPACREGPPAFEVSITSGNSRSNCRDAASQRNPMSISAQDLKAFFCLLLSQALNLKLFTQCIPGQTLAMFLLVNKVHRRAENQIPQPGGSSLSLAHFSREISILKSQTTPSALFPGYPWYVSHLLTG